MLNITFRKLAAHGELAQTLGRPARSAGAVYGRIPRPVTVLCRRIVAASGRLGGYSGWACIKTKHLLIVHESAVHGDPPGPGDKPVQAALL